MLCFSASVHVLDLLGSDNGADNRRSYHRLSRTGDNESSLFLTLSAFYRVFRHQGSHEMTQESRAPPLFGSRLVARFIKKNDEKSLFVGEGVGSIPKSEIFTSVKV